ncbi:hypothetical protein [Pseudomonas sp. GM78]|uniref:hypothetical protein n=1 Tax=Pseudomonas sp. GM78 TaxID=1144337 RepID=UPI00138AB77A|nr:hypothetical protein [Pseudomonas sp. GM78]
MTLLVGACTHQRPPDSGDPSQTFIADFASKTSEQLYSDLIGLAVYELSASYESDGYTVESANLRMPDRSQGYLVDVRSPDGSHFALIGGIGKNGVLKTTKSGERTFVPLPPEFDKPVRNDIVEGIIEKKPGSPTQSATFSSRAPVVIDVLAAYTRSAVNSGYVGADLNADARARLETVNLSLRNSRIGSISLRLVKTLIHEPSPKITNDTISNM